MDERQVVLKALRGDRFEPSHLIVILIALHKNKVFEFSVENMAKGWVSKSKEILEKVNVQEFKDEFHLYFTDLADQLRRVGISPGVDFQIYHKALQTEIVFNAWERCQPKPHWLIIDQLTELKLAEELRFMRNHLS